MGQAYVQLEGLRKKREGRVNGVSHLLLFLIVWFIGRLQYYVIFCLLNLIFYSPLISFLVCSSGSSSSSSESREMTIYRTPHRQITQLTLPNSQSSSYHSPMSTSGCRGENADPTEFFRAFFYLGHQTRVLEAATETGEIQGFVATSIALSKANLQAKLEADLERLVRVISITQAINCNKFVFSCRVCDGVRVPEDVLREQVDEYRTAFVQTVEQVFCFITYYYKYRCIFFRL